jgi:hypothetical protein
LLAFPVVEGDGQDRVAQSNNNFGVLSSEKQTDTMKLNTTLSVSICFLLLSGLSHAGDSVPFKATFHGFAASATPTADPNVFEIVVPLQGTATHLGKFDELLVHQINFLTLAFTGQAHWTAANGDTFTTVFHEQLYPMDDPALLAFEVTHTVVGGTGRFTGATGSFNGVNGLFNQVTGEDLGGYLGTFSY